MKETQMKDAFGLFAKNYKKYRGEPDKKLYKHIASLVSDFKTKEKISILDIGCGVGNSTEPLLKLKRVSVSGCDIDERMIKEARLSAKKNNLPINYVSAPAEKLSFEKESFNMAISGAAFHWFATMKAMNEIKRVLKKDGIYLVSWLVGTDNTSPVGVEIYKKYKWSGIPQKLRDIEYVKNIFIKAKFNNVQTVKIPTIEKRNIDDTLGLIKTNSMYSLLTAEQRKDFDISMKNAYKMAYKKDDIITTKHDMCICWGYK
ncbi:MAG: class I SAM-dependent methyltransferase [bacterium]